MDASTVAVLGAGGKTAAAVVAALAARGVPVRAAGRAEADLDTGRGLAEVLDGCAAVWLGAPNLHPDEPALVGRVVAAARRAGAGHLVLHSVCWPWAPEMPHHVDKAVAEDEVRRSGSAWTVLQPCAYAQNLLPGMVAALGAGGAPGTGRLEVPYDPDARFALVDLDDVAAATAAVLAAPAEHAGATYELGGPAAVSVREVAAAASRLSGRPVAVQRQRGGAWAAGPGAVLTEDARRRAPAMFAAYDRHGLLAGHLALEALLGRPATAVEQVLARALPAAGVAVSA